jgi:deoxycytidine triphosphate deaminase
MTAETTMSRTSTVMARTSARRRKFVLPVQTLVVAIVAETVVVPADVAVEVVAVRAVLVRAAAVEIAAAVNV